MLRSVSILLQAAARKTSPRAQTFSRCMSHGHVDVTHQASVGHRPAPAEAASLLDIGTRRIFSEEHDIFRTNVRRFFNEEVKPNEDKYMEQGQVDRELWLKAGENGLFGVCVPAEIGGIGGDYLSEAIVIEEQAYVNDASSGFALHSGMVMHYITQYGTKEQVERYLPGMMDGSCITALAMSEPSAGSDLQGIRTNAKQDGDDWILNGSKVFISNGWMADLVIVVAVTNPEAKSAAHGISLFLVEDGMPGFKKGRKLKKLGMHGQDTAELFFDDVRLPSSHILGDPNKGFRFLMQQLPQERLSIAIRGMAATEWMFEETRAYVKQRKAFGKSIGSLQTIQHRLAEMKTGICAARAFIDQCIQIHQERGLDSESASMAKYWCTDLQNQVATNCLQMHGGWGYMWEYPIARAFANARAQTIYGGTNEIMKELIGRRIVSDR